MPNSRISDLVEKQTLLSNGLDETADDDALVLLARAKSHNETIKYKNFKNSITDNSVYITGDQTVSGEKTFSDNAFFKSLVKTSRPSLKFLLINSSKPGSYIGEIPEFNLSILILSLSTQKTLFPRSAKQVPLTNPT